MIDSMSVVPIVVMENLNIKKEVISILTDFFLFALIVIKRQPLINSVKILMR
jgi:hypothetical protein